MTVIGCGCGGKKSQYVVTTADGQKVTVDTLVAAMNTVRQKGGTYQKVRA